jgi:hypothetical protein
VNSEFKPHLNGIHTIIEPVSAGLLALARRL